MKKINGVEVKRGASVKFVRRAKLVTCGVLGLMMGCAVESGTAADAQEEFEASFDKGIPEDYATAADYDAPVPAVESHEGHHQQEAAIAVTGTPAAHVQGKFGPSHTWPIIPIATMLNPNGTVFAYGTDTSGAQGADMSYVIWNQAAGTAWANFSTKSNIVHTDIFCAGQALIPGSGNTLLVGGDTDVNGEINYGIDNVTVYNAADGGLSNSQPMDFQRWYSTLITLPNNEHLVLGGRGMKDFNLDGGSPKAPTVATYGSTPEVRSTTGQWHSLTSADNKFAYGAIGSSWLYPRAWVDPQGKVFILTYQGPMYQLDPAGNAGTGLLKKYVNNLNAAITVDPGAAVLSSVMFAPGKIVTVRLDRKVFVIDINGSLPIVTPIGLMSADRQYGSSTVLADGKVWFNGGSPRGNAGPVDPAKAEAIYKSEMWDPKTGEWTMTASATLARLYHSTSMLLPDGSVFTGGGGAPGPLKNTNGEIYYPPYLYNTDGTPAVRPSLTYAPAALTWNNLFTVKSNVNITRVTLVRMGGATHTYNNETRFFELPLTTPVGTNVSVRAPESFDVAPPGFYMVFVWNAAGVPSQAKIVGLNN